MSRFGWVETDDHEDEEQTLSDARKTILSLSRHLFHRRQSFPALHLEWAGLCSWEGVEKTTVCDNVDHHYNHYYLPDFRWYWLKYAWGSYARLPWMYFCLWANVIWLVFFTERSSKWANLIIFRKDILDSWLSRCSRCRLPDLFSRLCHLACLRSMALVPPLP